jgi:ornithine carbamoyltransferase
MFEPGLGTAAVKSTVPRHLISVLDFSAAEVEELLRTANRLKKAPTAAASALKGKTVALIFEKPSTRTLVSFASGVQSMSGFPLVLQHDALQWKRGEPIADMARVMTRYVHGVMIRARHHTDVQEFARYLKVPVINGLTDREHPCQVLSDLQTLWERNGRKMSVVRGLKIVFLGDGNNMSNSWLLLASLLGLNFVLACPAGYDPDSKVMADVRRLSAKSGARITVIHDPQVAAQKADVLYTDVWTSMGQEAEEKRRKVAFKPFQINAALLAKANPHAVVLHCLPARRGEEITDDVIDGPQSIVFDQAENRLHMQKAILLKLMK